MKTLPAPNTLDVPKILIVVLAAFVFAGQTSAAVIYRNNFGNNTAGNIAFNNASIGWTLLRSEDGGNVTDDSSNVDNRGGIRNTTGRPADVGNVNAPASLSDSIGVAYMSNASVATYDGLASTSQYMVDRSIYDIQSFQWYANGTNGEPTQRLALEVGGNWYVTTSVAPPDGSFGTFDTGATQFTVDMDSADWFSLTFSVGSAPFTIGPSTTLLPAGNITEFGLFIDLGSTANAFGRFDTFTINAVPEPSVLSLIGLAGLGLLARRRRHAV